MSEKTDSGYDISGQASDFSGVDEPFALFGAWF
jgi:hypothetical protein